MGIKRLRLDWISVPILLLAVALVVGVGCLVWMLSVSAFYRDPGNRFAHWIDKSVRQAVQITYNSGGQGSTLGPDNYTYGALAGSVADQASRQRILGAQPFTSCPEGCETWRPYASTEQAVQSALHQDFSSGGQLPEHTREAIAAATSQSAQCAIRYAPPSKRIMPDKPKEAANERDVICLSPDSGALLYMYAED